MVKIVINGSEENVKDGLNVIELLKVKNVEMPETVSVELNGEFLEREKFEETVVGEGDRVEFLYFMGGGQQRENKYGKTINELKRGFGDVFRS